MGAGVGGGIGGIRPSGGFFAIIETVVVKISVGAGDGGGIE